MTALAWLTEVVAIVGGIAALLLALGVIAKSRVGKGVAWGYRKLFGDPITQWAHSTITAAVAPQLAQLRVENTAQHDQGARERKAGETRLTDKIDGLSSDISAVLADHATRISVLESRTTTTTVITTEGPTP